MKIRILTYRTKLIECDMPVRIANFLKKAGIKNLKDLFLLWNENDYRGFEREIMKIKGLGWSSAQYLSDFLKDISTHHYEEVL